MMFADRSIAPFEVAKKMHDFMTVATAAPLQEAAVAGCVLVTDITGIFCKKIPQNAPCFSRHWNNQASFA